MRRMMAVAAAAVLILLPLLAGAQAGGAFEFFPQGTYEAAIPTPASFLGYQIGERFTFHSRMKAYLEAVAAASDRVTIRSYGTSYEGRELLLVTVSSPANLARLEDIRGNMARLADPRGSTDAQLQGIVENSPTVAWLSYNVHGNESSCTEAAMQVVYQLAAGTDPVTRRILDECVVMIDPLVNPDGRDRYVASITKRLGHQPDPDSEAWEHGEDSPGGRVNHYLFDLNRDWAWMTQQETRQRIKEYLRWNPVVLADFHEMGGTSYFFFPADKPIHDTYPESVRKWQRIYGEGNAAAFDRFGWSYYTRQSFDMYYPAYGDSWPSMMGAIGMTYEQGGGGGVGVVVKQSDGTTHSLRARAHGHFTTSMATLRTTAERRRERMADFLGFFRAALDMGKGPVKAYALVPDHDGTNLENLATLLAAQGIEVDRVTSAFKARIAQAYGNTTVPASRDFPEGTLLVATGQPKGVAVKMLLEPRPALEDTSFYDLSAWSLPLVYGVEAWGLAEIPRAGQQRWTGPAARSGGGVSGERGAYSYAFPYSGFQTLMAVNDLLNQDLRVHVANKAFTSGGREFPRGTFLLPRYRNPEDLYDRLEGVMKAHGVTAYAVSSGLVEEGDDLGWSSYTRLEKPRIAVAGGFGLSSFGEVWFFLDQRYPCFDYTIVDVERLGSLDLEDYNVLILPSDGNGRRYTTWFGEAGLARLQTWLRAGGVIIGFEGGATFTTQGVAGLTSVTTQTVGGGGGGRGGFGGMGGGQGGAPGGATGAPPAGAGQQAAGGQQAGAAGSRRGQAGGQAATEPAVEARRTVAEREQEGGRNRMPGAVYEIVLDPDHWLAWGMPERIAILKRGGGGYAVSQQGMNVGVFSEKPLLSGYAPPQVPGELSKLSWLIVENVGRGKVILFADSPLFRMFLEGEFQLVLNAIILGPGI
jgi:hypothetical protein